MSNPFEELIQQLGKVLELELIPDHNNAVALKMNQKTTIQIQEDQEQNNLLIASILCELPPGRFRENVMAEALKTNALNDPRPGNLGYLYRKNALTLHTVYPFSQLDGKQLAVYLSNFLELAEAWLKAIERGQTGPEPRK